MTSTVNTNMLQELGLMNKPAVEKSRSDMGQSDFLTLMLTQLKNQDPMNPMESGEFLGQIAQFGTVAGIQDLQASFKQFSASIQTNQALQAATLAGKKILVSGRGHGFLSSGGSLNGAVGLNASTADMALGIYDRGGQLVRQINYGPQSAGLVRFSWDGKDAYGSILPPGLYTVRVAARSGNETVELAPMLEHTVESVTIDGSGQGLTLNVTGESGIDLSRVKEIR